MKQKLKFLNRLPVIIGIFLIIYTVLGAVYFDKHSQSKDMETDIDFKRTILEKPQPDINALNAELVKAKAELEAVQNSLPTTDQGIDIYNVLVSIGRSCKIKILGIEASSPLPPSDTISSPTFPYSIVIQGRHEDTLVFISKLIQGSELLQGIELRNTTITNKEADGVENVALDLFIHSWPYLTADGQDLTQGGGTSKSLN